MFFVSAANRYLLRQTDPLKSKALTNQASIGLSTYAEIPAPFGAGTVVSLCGVTGFAESFRSGAELPTLRSQIGTNLTRLPRFLSTF
jgi:hypothetical protein